MPAFFGGVADEAISLVWRGDCFAAARLAMTDLWVITRQIVGVKSRCVCEKKPGTGPGGGRKLRSRQLAQDKDNLALNLDVGGVNIDGLHRRVGWLQADARFATRAFFIVKALERGFFPVL